MDAIAAPFVQGRLRNESLNALIETRCGHCGQPMRLSLDSQMRYRVHDQGAEPLVFHPEVDWEQFTDPNIIHGF